MWCIFTVVHMYYLKITFLPFTFLNLIYVLNFFVIEHDAAKIPFSPKKVWCELRVVVVGGGLMLS